MPERFSSVILHVFRILGDQVWEWGAVSMEIWPAIDLRGGKCVRLRQGDYERETVFSDDPLEIARLWVEQGTERLHLVDLDGARDGALVNAEIVANIVRTFDVVCQLGGGIRDEATIRQLIDIGVQRLVVGTRAVREPTWFTQMCRQFPGKLVLGLDARGGQAATDGWKQTSEVEASKFARQFDSEPLAGVVYTDIDRDGMMSGPNVAAMGEMKRSLSIPVIASGGVTTVDDVARLAQIPMDGAIIGRSLYQGTLTLADARRAAACETNTSE